MLFLIGKLEDSRRSFWRNLLFFLATISWGWIFINFFSWNCIISLWVSSSHWSFKGMLRTVIQSELAIWLESKLLSYFVNLDAVCRILKLWKLSSTIIISDSSPYLNTFPLMMLLSWVISLSLFLTLFGIPVWGLTLSALTPKVESFEFLELYKITSSCFNVNWIYYSKSINKDIFS